MENKNAYFFFRHNLKRVCAFKIIQLFHSCIFGQQYTSSDPITSELKLFSSTLDLKSSIHSFSIFSLPSSLSSQTYAGTIPF